MRSTRAKLAIVAAVVALAVPAAVALAAGTSFKGKGTDDPDVAVKFKRHGGQHPYVDAFQTLNMLYECNDGSTTFRSGINLGTLKIKVKDNGKFSFHGTADEDGVHYDARISGKFNSNKQATGTTTETRSIGSDKCSAKEPWKATKKP